MLSLKWDTISYNQFIVAEKYKKKKIKKSNETFNLK
jgi:hypothetical protein